MIKSVADFMKVVEHFYPNDGKAFFRGQRSSNWAINSSLCRIIQSNFGEDDRSLHWRFSRSLFSEFERNIPIYPEASILRNYSLNQLDLMFVAQHYGLSTRLIDWSKSPLIALYFAVENVSDNDSESSAVYMIFDSEKQKVHISNSQAFYDAYVSEQKIWMEIYNFLENKISKAIVSDGQEFVSYEDASEINNIINGNYSKKAVETIHNFRLHSEFNYHQFFQLGLRLSVIEEKIFNLKEILERDKNHRINCLSEISNGEIFTDGNICLIEPLPINFRIKNQQGVFLFSNSVGDNVYGANYFDKENTVNSLENISSIDKKKGILKIIIKNEFAEKIKKELGYYGITKDYVYPELNSYTEVMQKRKLDEYVK